MADFSNNAVADYTQFEYRDGTPTKPAAVYIALFTTDPGKDGSGTEVTGSGYARVQHGPGNTFWTAADVAGRTSNLGQIAFPTATGDWSGGANITWAATYDAVSGGNIRHKMQITTPKPVLNGEDFVINEGDIGFTFD